MVNQAQMMEQHMETVKSFVQMFVDGFKADLKAMREENYELRRSLEYSQSEIADLKEASKLQADIIKKLECRSIDYDKLEDNVRRMDDNGRRANIIIDGLEDKTDETPEQTQHKVQSLLKEKLDVSIQLENASRIGRNTASSSVEGAAARSKPRMVLVRFNKISERQSVMKQSSKLKGTNVFLNDDVCRATMDIRRGKLEELKMKRKQGFIAYFSGADIKVVGRRQNTVVSENGEEDEAAAVLSGGNAEPLKSDRVLRKVQAK